jgi:hypothetical protein
MEAVLRHLQSPDLEPAATGPAALENLSSPFIAAVAEQAKVVRQVRSDGMSALPEDPKARAHVLTVFFLEEVGKELDKLRSENGGWLSTAVVDPTNCGELGYELASRDRELERFRHWSLHSMLDEVMFGYSNVWSIAADQTEQQLRFGGRIGPHRIVDQGYITLMEQQGGYRRHQSVSRMAQDGIGTFVHFLTGGLHALVDATPELQGRLPLSHEQVPFLERGVKQLTPWLLHLALVPGPILGAHFLRPLGLSGGHARHGVFNWEPYKRLWAAVPVDGGSRIGLSAEAMEILVGLSKLPPDQWFGAVGGCPAMNARVRGLNMISSEAKNLSATITAISAAR